MNAQIAFLVNFEYLMEILVYVKMDIMTMELVILANHAIILAKNVIS